MNQSRAKEIISSQVNWPHWGNYHRTMDYEEIHEITRLWNQAQGYTSFASIINRIARGVDPVTGK